VNLDALLAKTSQVPSGCWLWAGTIEENGYGRVYHAGRVVQAHRAVWIESGLPLDASLELDHLCRTRGCVNPAHLEPVTRAENARRKAMAKTHCNHGHPLSGENLIQTAKQRH
jgi:hypothetical protein